MRQVFYETFLFRNIQPKIDFLSSIFIRSPKYRGQYVLSQYVSQCFFIVSSPKKEQKRLFIPLYPKLETKRQREDTVQPQNMFLVTSLYHPKEIRTRCFYFTLYLVTESTRHHPLHTCVGEKITLEQQVRHTKMYNRRLYSPFGEIV